MTTESNRPFWWQFIWICVGMLFYTACRICFPSGLAAMQGQFHWTAFEVTVLATAFLLGQAVIDVPAGYWSDRFDRKNVLSLSLFGIGLFTVLVVLAGGFWSALVIRVLFGVIEGVYNIAQFAVAGSILPGSRALVNGLTQTFYGIGVFGTNTLVGEILHDYPGYWQLPLYILGGGTMVYAVITMGLFKRQYLRRYETKTELSDQPFLTTLGLVASNKRVWKAMSIHGINTLVNWAVLGMAAYIFTKYRQYDPRISGFVAGGYGIGALFVPFGTMWADKFGRRAVIVIIALIAAAAAFIEFNLSPAVGVQFALMAVIGWGIGCNYALGYTICQDAVATASMTGIGIATGMAGGFAYFIALFAGPLTGALIEPMGPLPAINLVVTGGEVLVALFAFLFLKGEMLPKTPSVGH